MECPGVGELHNLKGKLVLGGGSNRGEWSAWSLARLSCLSWVSRLSWALTQGKGLKARSSCIKKTLVDFKLFSLITGRTLDAWYGWSISRVITGMDRRRVLKPHLFWGAHSCTFMSVSSCCIWRHLNCRKSWYNPADSVKARNCFILQRTLSWSCLSVLMRQEV